MSAAQPVGFRPELLEEGLPPGATALLADAGALAARRGEGLFLVGGAVRDRLLGGHPVDLDCTVVGDGLAFAEALAERRGGTVVSAFPRFHTATYREGGLRLDLASSRRERYPAPGARPEVEPEPAHLDLRRRDFTVNAMALDLVPDRWGELLDPLCGREDLAAGRLRALHAGSFHDDPTRLLRGIRYAVRLRLAFETWTAGLVAKAAGARGLATLEPDRLLAELLATLACVCAPASGAARLAETGLLASLGEVYAPGPEPPGSLPRAVQADTWLAARRVPARDRPLPFLLVTMASSEARLARTASLLPLAARTRRRLGRVLSGELRLLPGIRGRAGATDAVLALLATSRGEEGFREGLALLDGEYPAPQGC